jgi:hypothetical protein
MVPIIQIVMVVPCQSEPSGLSREQFTKECNWIKLEEPRSRQHFILARSRQSQEQTTLHLSQEQTRPGADDITFK